MELVWLLDFVALARIGSFTEAAKARNSSQAAFSRRIQALEHWVGARLFERAAFPIDLTPTGKKFAPIAQSLITQIENAKIGNS
ncbi:LysR family transcriptional regulator [Devosia lucknowensis]|uniref:LysR family transcriptional regulator n=1 Tax=Devosia lucknowensis TaxID=1096929 RepID=UPI000A39D684|nr:LysR family transcriptional regulator [Devosia lucknowensis]